MNMRKLLSCRMVFCLAALVAIALNGSIAQAQSTGAKIAFVSTRDGNSEIYAMNLDGTNVVRLTNNAAADFLPSISPDSSKVVFTSSRDGNAEIYVVNSDGTGLARLTNNAADDEEPAFSGDGRRIFWSSDRAAAQLEIWRMNADGTAPVKFSNTGYAHDVAVSANNRKVLYATNDKLRLVNFDGSSNTEVPNSSGFLPAINRDATKILFPKGGISVINTDGSGEKVLIAGGSNPFFSPDTDRLVYEKSDGLYIANGDGTAENKIPNTSSIDGDPSFGGPPGTGNGDGDEDGPGQPVNLFQISVPYSDSTLLSAQTTVNRAFSLPFSAPSGATNFRLTRFNARTQAYEVLTRGSAIRRGEGYFLRPVTDEAVEAIEPGVNTIIKTPADDRSRRALSASTFEITLNRKPSLSPRDPNNGWNLIGFPFDPNRFSSSDWFNARVTLPDGRVYRTVRQAIGGGVLGNVLFTFDSSVGRYRKVTTLEPFKGYFVQTFVDGAKVTLKAQ